MKYFLLSFLCTYQLVTGTEFAFDLPRNDVQCFFEEINENILCNFEYQVLKGGKLDIDVIIQSPSKLVVYKELRKEYDRFKFNTTESGEHRICFSNEFSTFTEKSIFVLFEAGQKDRLLQQMQEDNEEMTFMEKTTKNIYTLLSVISIYLNHIRMTEGHGLRFAEELNSGVLRWSLLQTFLIVIIGISQVLVLRKFFNDPSPRPKTTVRLSHHTDIYG